MAKDVTKRTDNLLQEIRIVLPGTQALLGFQFIAFFNESFKTLPSSLQLYHLVNLLLVSCCAILLLTPVGYEEIGDNGRPTERFVRFSSRMITTAMFFLLAGMAGDIFVAGYLLKAEQHITAIAAAAVFIFGNIMWFGLTMAKRRK